MVFWAGFLVLVVLVDFAVFAMAIAVVFLAVLMDFDVGLVLEIVFVVVLLETAASRWANLRSEKQLANEPAKISKTIMTKPCERMMSAKLPVMTAVASLIIPVLGTKVTAPRGGR